MRKLAVLVTRDRDRDMDGGAVIAKAILALAAPCAWSALPVALLAFLVWAFKRESDLDHTEPVPWAKPEAVAAHARSKQRLAVAGVLFAALVVGGLLIVALGGY